MTMNFMFSLSLNQFLDNGIEINGTVYNLTLMGFYNDCAAVALFVAGDLTNLTG